MNYTITIIIGAICTVILYFYSVMTTKKDLENDIEDQRRVLLDSSRKRWEWLGDYLKAFEPYKHYDVYDYDELRDIKAIVVYDSLTFDQKIELELKISDILDDILSVLGNLEQQNLSQDFLDIQVKLSALSYTLDNDIRQYNNYCTLYNNAMDKFPNNLFNKIFKFERKHLLEYRFQ